MIRTSRSLLPSVSLALLLAAGASPAHAAERSEIPERLKWDLSKLYPSDAAWRSAREGVAKKIEAIAEHKGKLGQSAEALWRGLDAAFGADLGLQRLLVYASARSDEDTRVAATREMRQIAQQLAVDLESARSFLRPEILSLDPARVRAWIDGDKRLAEYRFFVEDVLRARPHTLSAAEERIAAEASDLAGVPGEIYGLLRDADLPWPTVKLSAEEVRIDPATYSRVRASRLREDRLAVFEAFFGALRQYERTIGAALFGTVRAHVVDTKIHAFGSSLEAALFPGNIPTAVYRQLVADVRRSLPTFHRYLALRKRMLGVGELRYEDLYAPLVASVDLQFSLDEARAVTLEAFAPLGRDYVAALANGYRSRWTDFLPSTGKQSGAYSWGVYGIQPIQLLNYHGSYVDLTTLAHEAGHSMHRVLAEAQPYATHDSPVFVAEVASTLNENLLLHHMLARARDDATRLALLGNYLEVMRQTLFRQTSFAEFELAIHEKAEGGEALTGEGMSRLYLDIARAYHGHAQGVCEVRELIGVEWALVPHFHRGFYVFQYATSLVASTSIAKAIREEAKQGRTRARDAYLAMLRAGGSRYPIDLLRSAGVDMTTSAPFQAAMAEMNAIMDQMEAILARQEKAKGGKRK